MNSESSLLSFGYGHPFLLLLLLGGSYVTVLSIFRVFFSPLAKFPGPKLAGKTGGPSIIAP